MSKLKVNVGDVELNFNVSNDDFNQYINEQLPHDKVGPGFNFLSRTVVDDDRENFKKALVLNDKPKGILVMQVAGLLAGEFGGEVKISLKK